MEIIISSIIFITGISIIMWILLTRKSSKPIASSSRFVRPAGSSLDRIVKPTGNEEMTLSKAIGMLESTHGGEVTSIKFSHNKMKIFYQINFGPELEIDATPNR